MKPVLMVVAYDGTNYNGWQIQPNGDTIEGQLNKHLSLLLNEDINVIGASRTDAGVHALCNMAVFDTNARMPAEKISYAMNQRLPEDIKVLKSYEVELDFHPRKVETRKTYEYKIYNAQFPNPLHSRNSYFTYVPLDVEKMKKAASYLIGEHDFAALSTFKPEVESTVRTIYELTVEAEDLYANVPFMKNSKPSPKMITIRVLGNGFLYNMVRIIAGTLMDVGRGKIEVEAIKEILDSKDRSKAGPTAPACGLTLANYEFI